MCYESFSIISSWLTCAWLLRHLKVIHYMLIKSTTNIQMSVLRKTLQEEEIEDFVNKNVSNLKDSDFDDENLR